MSFSWAKMFAEGARGVETLSALLRADGCEVTDLAQVRLAQQRGIDLVVDGQLWEVKTDSHPVKNIFLELTVGEKPGCIFHSRADVLAYWFPQAAHLVCLGLPDLQLWLFEHGAAYERRRIRSSAGASTWSAQGLIVPLTALASLPSYEVHTWPIPLLSPSSRVVTPMSWSS
jgi:hypothetical protein